MANSDMQSSNGEKKSRGPGLLVILLAVLVGVAVGAASGAFLAGPYLARHVVDAVDRAGGGARVAGPASGAPGAAARTAAGTQAVHKIESLVVNPAGSGGTRFLMLSLAVAVADTGAVTRLEQHDVEVRDAVLHVLGQKSIVELANIDTRDSLKLEVGAAVDSVIGAPVVRGVFFPNYVIQ